MGAATPMVAAAAAVNMANNPAPMVALIDKPGKLTDLALTMKISALVEAELVRSDKTLAAATAVSEIANNRITAPVSQAKLLSVLATLVDLAMISSHLVMAVAASLVMILAVDLLKLRIPLAVDCNRVTAAMVRVVRVTTTTKMRAN